MNYVIVHKERNKLQVDGFTYGDWRQYVAFFPDNSARCCRVSSLPATIAMVGMLFFLMAVCGVLVALGAEGTLANIIWPRVLWTAAIGLMLWIPWAITWFTPWRLMVTVSERMMPDERGVYTRSF